ncbi:hypothetical protein ACFWPQ_08560 [Streptomyces sp. NPDC058464]|uniref:hypothetical protein n=1 Tax=Streptomyces sp. NPDC058464 TaxID=3346511 RepID=UPI00365727B1
MSDIRTQQERAEQFRSLHDDFLVLPNALGTVARETGLKINAMWLPGAPAPEELRDAGVSRYSAGTAIAQVAYTGAFDAARSFLAGLYTPMVGAIDYFAFNDKFAK